MTKTIIVDDHPIVLQGCLRLIKEHGACEVRGTPRLLEAFQFYRREKPDIMIVDLGISNRTLAGLGFIRRLRSVDKGIPILVFSMHVEPSIIRKALAAGATGYVHKDSPPEEIILAFDRVRAGQRYIAGDLAMRIAFAPERPLAAQLKDFTRREQEILALLAVGKSYGEIAEELGVSYKTVANVSSILKSKLDAETLPDLVVKAIQRFTPKADRR